MPSGTRSPNLAISFLLVEQRVGRRNVLRHRHLMLQALFVDLEGRLEREDRLAVLDGDHAPRGEGAAVADAVDLVDDRHLGVARPHEIAVQRMHVPVGLDGALRGDQRLGDGLAAEDALPVELRAATTIQVVFQLLQVENGEKLLHGRRHFSRPSWNSVMRGRFPTGTIGQVKRTERDGKDGEARNAAERPLDVLVAGAGYVGLATAVSLKQARPSLGVAIVDAAPAGVWEKDTRASAIAAAACRMLDRLGCWDGDRAARRRRSPR